MAGTTPGEAPDRHYVDYDEYVDFQIEKARGHIKATDIFTTLTTVTAAFVGYLLLFVVFDQWIFDGGFSDGVRVAMLSVVLLVLGTILMRRVVLPLIRRVHPLYAARMLEQADPNLQSNLLNFVDVRESQGTVSSPVLRAMEKRAAVELSHIDVDEAIDRRPLLRVAYALLGIVVVAALYVILSPKDPFPSVWRALRPTAPIDVATQTTISEVTPGDDRVPARSLLTIEADIRGPEADSARILFSTSDNKYVDQAVEMRRIEEGLPRYRGTLNGENGRGLLQSLSYSIVAGDARSRKYEIEVVQPPSARVEEVQYVFPPYMHLTDRTNPGGNIDGWEGASVTLSATANMPVKSAAIVLTDTEDPHAKGEEIPMQVVDGTKLSAKWKLDFRSDGTFPRFHHLQVKTARGETDPDPTVYTIRIRPDQRPEVTLLFPTGDLRKAPNAVIPLSVTAADPDFGLRSITLKAERAGEEIVSEPLFDGEELGVSHRGNYDWNLAKSNLRPGDVLQFWIEAKDTKQPVANRGITPRLRLEISNEKKSAEEVRQDLAEEKKKQNDQIARADGPKNAEGKEPSERNPGDDRANESRPEDRPGAEKTPQREGDRTPPKPDEALAKPRNGGREPQDPSKTADDPADPQRSRPGEDPQKVLEKLLQRQADEQEREREQARKEQPEETDRNRTEPSEPNDKSSGNKNQGSGKKAGDSKPNESKSSEASKEKGQGSESNKSSDGNGNKEKSGNSGANRKSGSNSKDSGEKEASSGKKAQEKEAGKESSQEKKAGDSAGSDKQGKPNEKTGRAQPQQNQKSGEPKPEQDRRKDEGKSQGNANPKGGEQEPNDPSQSNPGGGGDKNSDKKGEDKGEDKGSDKGSSDKGGDKQGDKGSGGEEDRDKAGKGKEPGDKGEDKGAADKPNDKAGQGEKSSDKEQTGEKKRGDESKEKSAKGGEKGPPSDGTNENEKPSGKGEGDQPKRSDGSPAKKSDDAKNPDSDPQSKGGGKGKEQADGPQKPAADTPDAKKGQATGNEQGEATGSREKDPDAPRAKDDLQRRPDSEQGATQESKDPENAKPGERRKPQEGTSSATDDPKEVRRDPDGQLKPEQPGKIDDPASEQPEKKGTAQKERRPGEPPDAGNQPQKGEGRKERQQSAQGDTGEKGESAASDQGQEGANKEGAGDKSDEAGDSERSKRKTGTAGDKPGKGSTSKPAEKGSGSKAGSEGKEPGAGEQKSGKEEGKGSGQGEGESASGQSKQGEGKGSGEGKKGGDSSESGSPGGKSSSSGAPGNSSSSRAPGGGASGPLDRPQEGPGAAGSAPGDRPDHDPSEPPTAEEEQANLDYAREASNLLLTRLKRQLERGELDQKLLDEMGWKDASDVIRFKKWLEENLKSQADDGSPEALARRLQFEETLKGMRLRSETESRKGDSKVERRVLPTAARNVRIPAEYREQHEAYTKSLAKQNQEAPKKTSEPAKKPANKK